MDKDLITTGLIFTYGVVGFIKTLCQKKIKRVNKVEGFSIVGYLEVPIILFFGGSLLNSSWLYAAIGLIGTIIVYLIRNYFKGVSYSITVDNEKNILELLCKAIRDVEGVMPEKIDENKYQIPDTKKLVVYSESHAPNKNKKYYSIRFKRWISPLSRKTIMKQLELGIPSTEEMIPLST